MARRFVPHDYQRAERRFKRKKAEATEPDPPEPPYRVMSLSPKYWWRPPKVQKQTDLFYISFSVPNDPEEVYDALAKVYGPLLGKVCRWEWWYEVQLTKQVTWREVAERTDEALRGLFP